MKKIIIASFIVILVHILLSLFCKKIKKNNKEFKETDIAILSLGGIVNSSSIRIADSPLTCVVEGTGIY